jgi:hypothetical protein
MNSVVGRGGEEGNFRKWVSEAGPQTERNAKRIDDLRLLICEVSLKMSIRA